MFFFVELFEVWKKVEFTFFELFKISKTYFDFLKKLELRVSNTNLCMELCFEPKLIDEDIMVENTANRTENISKFEKNKK